jgi:hypothetical protein
MRRDAALSKEEQYRRDARLAHLRAERADLPQEKVILLSIEREFERLAEMARCQAQMK